MRSKKKKNGVATRNQSNRNFNTSLPSKKLCEDLLKLYREEDFEKAGCHAAEMTKKFPTSQFAWKVLGASLRKTGDKLAALDANKRAVKLQPKDPDAQNNLGNSLK